MSTATKKKTKFKQGIYLELPSSYAVYADDWEQALKLSTRKIVSLMKEHKKVFDAASDAEKDAKLAREKADSVLKNNKTLQDHLKTIEESKSILRESFSNPDAEKKFYASIAGTNHVIKKHTFKPRVYLERGES